MRRERATWRGFTLIEVLVVLGIIAVLAAILIPVFLSARRRGQETTCLSNLRQLGQATFLYAQDNDDQFPFGGDAADEYTDGWDSWMHGKYADEAAVLPPLQDVMKPYVGNPLLWRCPADDGYDEAGLLENIPLSAHPSSFAEYGISYDYMTLLTLTHQTLGRVRAWSYEPPYSEQEPVMIPLLSDMVGAWHGGLDRQSGRLNFVFVDGHARSVTRAEADKINSIEFHLPAPSDTP